MPKILLKRGSPAAINQYTGEAGEVLVDVSTNTLVVQDGHTAGGIRQARLSDIPTKTSQLTNDIGAWGKTELTKVSQLTNDSNYWSKSSLTKVSQLSNDSGFKNNYCTYCTYCQQCSRCHNCTTVNCTTVQCTTVNCTTVKCTTIKCGYDADNYYTRD